MSPSPHPKDQRLFPAWLDLRGTPVLMVGGGRVARRKTLSLIEAKADLTVVAPRFLEEFLQWQESGYLSIHKREFEERDLEGKRLVFACTDNEDLNEAILKGGKERGALGGSATSTAEAEVFPGYALRRGGLSISLSSGGGAPLVSRVLRECLEDLFPEDWEHLSREFARERRDLLEDGLPLDPLEEKIRQAFYDAVRQFTKHSPERE